MGYDSTGVDIAGPDRSPYAVVLRALTESELESDLEWASSESVGKVVETRLIFEDPWKDHPCPTSYDSYKIRTSCRVNGRLSRADVEEWLASRADGKEIPGPARDDVLRLVFDAPNDPRAAEVGFDVWVDEFIPGKGRDQEAAFDYWFDDDLEANDDNEEEDEWWDGPVAIEAMQMFKHKAITEEAGCAECGVDKAEVGSIFMWLPCSHSFHFSCIFDWMIKHSYCPTCNYRLPVQNYKDYPCVCTECLCLRHFDPTALLPDHPPPFLKFY